MTRDLFSGDSRAVAPAIGFILFIGIFVLLLSVYQAQIIPQQNAETELEHHQETRDELRALDHAISAVSADENPRFETINLGTSYEDRTLGINPPPPAGTIRTEEHNISIANESGTQTNIPTQFIEYQPGYNELDIGSTWYEHSVLYLDERDRGNSLNVIEDQDVIDDGNVTIVALQNEFQATGTGRVTFELYPSNELENVSLPEDDGNYSVEVPTRVNGTEYWDDALAEADEIYQGVDNMAGDDPHVLNLSVEPDALELNPVGISLEPDEEVTITEERDAAKDLTVDDDAGNLLGSGATGEGQGPGKFEFGIRNSGDNDLELVALGIINTSTDAVEVSRNNPNQPRLSGDDRDLITENIIINDGTDEAERYNFTDNKRVPLDGEDKVEDFEFFQIKDEDDNNVDMSNARINMTVWVENEDGEESQTTLTLRDEEEEEEEEPGNESPGNGPN